MKALLLTFLLMSVSLVSLSNNAIAQQIVTADLNGDGIVNLGDIAIVASHWLSSCSCDGKQCGDDGCGGSCGTCGPYSTCNNGDCISQCNHVGFEISEHVTVYDGDWQILDYYADFYSGNYTTTLSFEFYQSLGGPASSGTYLIPNENYSTTNLAVLIVYNCDEECEKTFLANSGTLVITSIGSAGEHFTGSLSDVELIEVTIDPSTLESTPVDNGEDWCISEYSFDTIIY